MIVRPLCWCFDPDGGDAANPEGANSSGASGHSGVTVAAMAVNDGGGAIINIGLSVAEQWANEVG